METDTPTFRMMNELIGTYGLSEEFLWNVISSQPSLMYAADLGYVEFIGPTLKRLERVYVACKALSKDSAMQIPAKDFLQSQILAKDTETGVEYKRAGEYIADGELSVSDSVYIARESTQSDINDSRELMVFAAKGTPPGKYHPVLRAIKPT